MRFGLTRGRCAFGCLLLAAVAILVFRLIGGLHLNTDLFSLIPVESAPFVREVADSAARRGSVLIEGGDATRVKNLADTVVSNLQQSVRLDGPTTLRYLADHGSGLLAPETRDQLEAGKYAEVMEDALARLFGPLPPLVSVSRDPFLLVTGYMMSLQSSLADGWTFQDGYPVCEKSGRHFLLLTLDTSLMDERRMSSFLAWAQTNSKDRDEKIWCCGPAFHTCATTQRARRDINFLSLVSLVFVVLLGTLLFRSLRFIPCLLFSIGSAFLVATAALVGVYPHAHVLTFVFGTSLIGLSVDYAYHARAAGGAVHVVRPLTYSLLTTLACFVPLAFAVVPVLRQMALFTTVGLTTAYASVFLVGGDRRTDHAAETRDHAWRFGNFVRLAVFGVSIFGLAFLSVRNDPTVLYRPMPYLAAGESRLAKLNPSLASRFAYVRGDTLQEALEREEAAGLKGLSRIVPSLARQRRDADLIRRLYEAKGVEYRRETGLKTMGERSSNPSFLDAESLEDPGLRRLVQTFRARHGLIVPCPRDFVPHDPAIVVIDPQQTMTDLFTAFYQRTRNLLGCSLALLVVVLVVLFRRSFFRMVLPIVASCAATAGVLGWLCIPVTFFTLLCFFVLIGLGLDYVIFNQSHPEPETRRTVFYSFLTSIVGLGMLVFTAFPVTHDMGLVFACGLAFSFAASLPSFSSSSPSRLAPPAFWKSLPEQSAGRFRLAVLWYLYVVLGKNVLKIVCIFVMAFIYPFARPARKSLQEFYSVLWKGKKRPGMLRLFKHLLGFAWSLADKTDACTLKKNLPKMTLRLDEGGRAFQNLVAAKKGAFLISTHVGTIEVLPALAAGLPQGDVPRVHAFQQMGHDAVFTQVFMKHFDSSRLMLHAVEDIGVETAVQMQEAIARGELVLMAGDRVSAGSGKTLSHEFLGQMCRWPKGVFAFAKLMEAPVFFTTCVRTGWNAYEVHMAEFKSGNLCSSTLPRVNYLTALLAQYVSFLTAETLAHPEQWYQFYSFFSPTPNLQSHA